MAERIYDFDKELELKDAGLVAASAAATVGGNAKILDMRSGRIDGTVVVDVSAIEIASNDEEYDILVQGSTDSGFAAGSIENLAQLNLGATEVRQGAAKDSATGRREIPFTNYVQGTVYRYLRLYTVVAGSIATGINYKAFLAKLPGT